MKQIKTSALWTFLVLSLLLINGCKNRNQNNTIQQTQYNERVIAFTSGVIPKSATIYVRFTNSPANVTVGLEVDDDILDFSPSIKGKAFWKDAQTIEFTPDELLPSGTNYSATVKLDELFPNVKDDFEFNFKTISQNFRVENISVRPINNDNLEENILSGEVILADFANDELVEKLLTITHNGDKKNISWQKNEGTHSYNFVVSNIIRGEKASTVSVEWNGQVLNVDKKGSDEIEIPALSDFKLQDINIIQQPTQCIEVVFSDPIDKNQSLNGLLTIGSKQVKYLINNNTIKVYPKNRLAGEFTFKIFPGIKNTLGYELITPQEYQLSFESLQPAIQLIGKGVIMPGSTNMSIPFKAVNLKAVMIKVVQIYENNIGEFLQVNDLSGNQQLKRAGRLIKKKTILLNEDRSLDLGRWNTFSLDLSDLFTADQGSIYRIEFSFKLKHAIYPCSDQNEDENEDINQFTEDDIITENEESYWDTPSSYEYSYWDSYEDDYGYNWEDRNNPCSSSYYQQHRYVSKNVLASNLGIIVKKGDSKEIKVIVTEITSTQPLENVSVEAYNYQNQLIGSVKTDKNGISTITTDKKPYLIIAKKDKERGYLKVNDGTELSVSSFDISGTQNSKGIKGLIYGERGVWRPGDTLHLSFILEDKNLNIKDNHPIILELFNPHGKLIKRDVSTVQTNGINTFTLATAPDAPTGFWQAKISVGNSVFHKSIRIETVKPNRLKVELQFEDEILSASSNQVNATLSSKWLHGAIARNLDAKVDMLLNPMATSFKGYSEFTFTDPSKEYYPEEITIFDGSLNENGVAKFSTNIKANHTAPGFLKANFRSRVFEESGNFSSNQSSIIYSPYSSYVGIKLPKGDNRGMLLTDTVHTIKVATLNTKGEGLSRSLSYTIYKVNWRWWWETSEDNLGRYIESSSANIVKSGKLRTSNGTGEIKFSIAYPSWGRYLIKIIDSESGHSCGKTVYVDWPGWAKKSRGNSDGASILSFNTDKQNYEVGNKATVEFPSSAQGRALISIENSTKVIASYWAETKENSTSFSFNITDEMAPNAYINITLLQPHGQNDNNLPIRMYGIVPIMVENPETHLTPVLEMPDELKPESEVTIKIKEANKQPMTYTIAIVDDGLLDLTNFSTPKPWNYFYAKEAHGIKTWDIYDYVINSYGGQIERIFGIGGDEDMEGKKEESNTIRFKPMVRFAGPFTLNKGKTNTHKIDIPRYVGSVRTMVIARNNYAYGETEKTTPVRNPLMVLGTLPRALGPNETVSLPVTVFAMKEGIKNVKVEIETSDILKINGDNKKTITFDQPGDKVVNFQLKVAEYLGKAKVSIKVSSGKHSAINDIELDVRNPNPPLTKVIEGAVEPNSSAVLSYQYHGMTGTNSAILELSSIPPIDFGRRLKYLLRYPHGCVEQTTSAAFPQLYLTDIIDAEKSVKQKTEENIKAAINRLAGFIKTDGGFSYWPTGTTSDDWGTSYAGHFFIEAEKKGYTLPYNFKKNWVRFQQTLAREWGLDQNSYTHAYSSDLNQAYRLYTLALAGKPELSSMNRMRKMQKLSSSARYRLAAAYALAGQQEAATELIANLPIGGVNEQSWRYNYGSETRDKAMILETLVLLKEYNQAIPLVKEIAQQLSSQEWMSTQTTAYALIAITNFTSNKTSSKQLNVDVNTTKYRSDKTLLQVNLDPKNGHSETITVTNKSDGVIFARIIVEGTPLIDSIPAIQNNVTFKIAYEDLDGNAIDVSAIEQGTDFVAITTIYNTGILGSVDNIALSQIFPSGWEIRNIRMENNTNVMGQANYQDIRDDRVYSYFDLPKAAIKKFKIQLNAAYIGKYFLPALSCEAMYNNALMGRIPGQWVEVINVGNK